MNSSISELLSYLTSAQHNNFFGRIMAALEIQEARFFPAMAVTIRDRHYVLLYNPEWYAKAEYKEVMAIVEHEMMHIVFEHLPRYLALRSMASEKRKSLIDSVMPFAADMAVNTLLMDSNDWIRDNKDDLVIPEHAELPTKQTYEFYTQQLINKQKEQKKQNAVGGKNATTSPGAAEGSSQSGGGGDSRGDHTPDSLHGNEDGDGDEDGSGSKAKTKTDGKSERPHSARGNVLSDHETWKDVIDGLNEEDLASLADELRHDTQQIVEKAVNDTVKMRGTVPEIGRAHV